MTMTVLSGDEIEEQPRGWLPFGRPLTAADLESAPDDGHRYELIDGVLIVTPSPAVPHQRAVGNLHFNLRLAVSDDFEVMLAPLDVTVSDSTVLQPDLLVAPRRTLTGRKMVGLPVLAIEVLSPSTRLIDLRLKRAKFEEIEIDYWVIDPIKATLTVFAADGSEPVVIEGEATYETDRPFPIRVCPAELTR